MAEKETTDINREYDIDNYDDGKIYSLKRWDINPFVLAKVKLHLCVFR